jgi:hypothetical protein
VGSSNQEGLSVLLQSQEQVRKKDPTASLNLESQPGVEPADKGDAEKCVSGIVTEKVEARVVTVAVDECKDMENPAEPALSDALIQNNNKRRRDTGDPASDKKRKLPRLDSVSVPSNVETTSLISSVP